jgi:hypothetical protein
MGGVSVADQVSLEAIKSLTQIQSQDNNVLNQKLSQYLAVQTLIVVVDQKAGWGHIIPPVLGLLTSLIWFFSIGRTIQYRRHWKLRIKKLVDNDKELEPFDFGEPPGKWYGALESQWVQLTVPVLGMLLWIVLWCRSMHTS